MPCVRVCLCVSFGNYRFLCLLFGDFARFNTVYEMNDRKTVATGHIFSANERMRKCNTGGDDCGGRQIEMNQTSNSLTASCIEAVGNNKNETKVN